MRPETHRSPWFIFALLALVPGCFGSVERGNGVEGTEARDVGEFEGIVSQSQVDVMVTIGDEPSIEISCDENLLDDIETLRRDGDLVVRTRSQGVGRFVQIEPTLDCVAYVVVPDLERATSTGSSTMELEGEYGLTALTATGSGNLVVHGTVSAETVSMTSTGSGGIAIDEVIAEQVNMTATGSGGVGIGGGTTGALALTVTGSGEVLARGLGAGDVAARLTGSGDAELTAFDSLEARISGSGNLAIWGDPDRQDVNTTGSGEVRYMD